MNKVNVGKIEFGGQRDVASCVSAFNRSIILKR